MSMLDSEQDSHAYGKVGIYGAAGSGKSRTAAEIAIGLSKLDPKKRPVAVFDTEPAWSWLRKRFQQNGVELKVYSKSRAFADLMAWTREAQQSCGVIVVDSITHVWRDLQASCLKRINDGLKRRGRPAVQSLEFQHWGSIKSQWAEFTDLYISSPVHFIICGRAGSVYEYQEKSDGSGKRELISTGTKMATEKELGHEPSLLIEMVANKINGQLVNTAVVIKDRADELNGMELDMPTFESFTKHFDQLDLNGRHFGSMETRESSHLFQDDGADFTTWRARQKEIALDEIKTLLEKHHPGATQAAKESKASAVEKVANTRSWEALCALNFDDLRIVRSKLWIDLEGFDYLPPKVEAENV